jgi:hypothetical protein
MSGDAAAEAASMVAAVRDDPALDRGIPASPVARTGPRRPASYAWTNGERHPWTPVRGHRIMPFLTWLTS